MKKLIIHILCNDGSPLGVTSKSLWGDNNYVGVGGSEYALLTMCEEWQKIGHTVILFNDPKEFDASPFEQRAISLFRLDEKRNVLINFRSPNPITKLVKNCLKIWWSTDQYSVGDYADFANYVDKIVCISPRHVDFFKQTYGITKAFYIDLPIRLSDFYEIKEPPARVPYRLLFSSVPDRGLDNLWRIYPKIQARMPDVSLVITSDYRLWGTSRNNEHFLSKWIGRKNVQFLSAVSRDRLLREQLQAEVLLYPSNYDELFCVSVAEAQVAGVYPITSDRGALSTTNMGRILSVDANNPINDVHFVNAVVDFFNNNDRYKFTWDVRELAVTRFSPETILKEWEHRVFNEHSITVP